MSNSRNSFRYIFINKPQIYSITLKKDSKIKPLLSTDACISDLSATGCSIELEKEIETQNSFIYIETFINNKKYSWKTKSIWNKKINNSKYKYGLQFLQDSKQEQEILSLIYSMQTKRRN
jgi:c-di-GMP-binding flagellar brake protein YcgR